MNSSENYNTFKYFTKIVVIFIIVFLVLKFIINLRPYEAILLACIIAVSILIIENLFYINDKAKDPLNCDECIVQRVEPKNLLFENFETNNQVKQNLNNLENDIIQNSSNQSKSIPQLQQNISNTISDVIGGSNSNTPIPPQSIYSNTPQTSSNIQPVQSVQSVQDNVNTSTPLAVSDSNKSSNAIIENSTNNKNELDDFIQKQNKQNQELVKNFTVGKNPTEPTVNTGTFGGVSGPEASFDVGYVKYQQDGLQKIDRDISEKNNLFKAGVGNQTIVQEYWKDGRKYYDTIYERSTDAPKTYEALNNELKYGEYNYIGPLNKGMINKAYTFISPTNWFPIQPHPPVCVTNKSCTTCPITITDGKDYMNFAALEDFDNARRFTGDMGINIDYVKNVLNNPNSY